MRTEVDKFPDGRLKLMGRFRKEDSSFWIHDDGTYTWVMKKEEIETIRKALEAIDSYNLNSRES